MATSKIDLLIFFINLFIENGGKYNHSLFKKQEAKRAGSREQGAWSRERGAGSMEHRA